MPLSSGTYYGAEPWVARLRAVVLLLIGLAFMAAGAAMGFSLLTGVRHDSSLAAASLGALAIGALVFGVMWPQVRAGGSTAAWRVLWDEQGLEVTDYKGERTTFRWDELLGLEWAAGYLVFASGGRSFVIGSRRHEDPRGGYRELGDALEARIWGRDPTHPQAASGSPGPAAAPTATECLWCGETFPAGTRKCPQCGRAVVS
jgi:hypothetical protein